MVLARTDHGFQDYSQRRAISRWTVSDRERPPPGITAIRPRWSATIGPTSYVRPPGDEVRIRRRQSL